MATVSLTSALPHCGCVETAVIAISLPPVVVTVAGASVAVFDLGVVTVTWPLFGGILDDGGTAKVAIGGACSQKDREKFGIVDVNLQE